MAVIGNIGRFHRPEKLVAYIGLNLGQCQSAKSFILKLHKLAVVLGTSLRAKLQLGQSLAACVQTLRQRSMAPKQGGIHQTFTPNEQPI